MAGGEGARPAVTNLAPRLTPAADALLHTDIPIIAGMNGAAIGWGMELSLMADIRVASEKARFGELVHQARTMLRRTGNRPTRALVGRENCGGTAVTGDIIDANRAQQIRLVSRVVPHEQLMPAATVSRARSASNPPLAIRIEGVDSAAPSIPGLGRNLERGSVPAWPNCSKPKTIAKESESFWRSREPHFAGK